MLGLKECVFLTSAGVTAIVDAKVAAHTVGDAVGMKHSRLERVYLDRCTVEDRAMDGKGTPMLNQIRRGDILGLRTKYATDGIKFTSGVKPTPPRVAKDLYSAKTREATAAAMQARLWSSGVTEKVDANWAALSAAAVAKWTAKEPAERSRYRQEMAAYMGDDEADEADEADEDEADEADEADEQAAGGAVAGAGAAPAAVKGGILSFFGRKK